MKYSDLLNEMFSGFVEQICFIKIQQKTNELISNPPESGLLLYCNRKEMMHSLIQEHFLSRSSYNGKSVS